MEANRNNGCIVLHALTDILPYWCVYIEISVWAQPIR
jgi:hypothetical protein